MHELCDRVARLPDLVGITTIAMILTENCTFVSILFAMFKQQKASFYIKFIGDKFIPQ